MKLATRFKKINKALKVDTKMRLHWRGILCVMAASLLICWLFDHFGRFDLARPVMALFAVIGFVIAMRRDLVRYAWFWITMILLVALHIPMLLFIPWTTNWVPAVTTAGICTIDLYVMLTVVYFVEKFMAKDEATET